MKGLAKIFRAPPLDFGPNQTIIVRFFLAARLPGQNRPQVRLIRFAGGGRVDMKSKLKKEGRHRQGSAERGREEEVGLLSRSLVGAGQV